MRSRLALLFLLVIFLFTTACGQQGPRPVSFMVFGEPAELKAYQDLVAAFEKQHPEIKVELIHIPSQGDYRKRLAADLVGGEPADVVLINYRRFSGLALKNAFEPLGPYLEKSESIAYDDFYALSMRAFSLNDQVVCIPQNISSLVAYYNKDLFDAAGIPHPDAGWTWDEFISASKALTLDVDSDGRVDQYGAGVEPTLIRVAPFVWQNGGKVSINNALTLAEPLDLEAVQWFVDWQVTHHIVPNAEEEKAESSESRFINGRVAIYFNSRRLVPTFREITAFDWDVAPLPVGRSDATILHSDAYCLTAASQHKEDAWTFIEFANSAAGQSLIAQSGRTVPSLIQVAESDAFLDPNAKPEHSRVFLDVIPFTLRLPQQANWADIEEICDEELQRAFFGEVTALEAMQSAVERTLSLFTENE
ncbi:MAG TPA: sugar ABC transporter substrate-binding protein [Anaerolineales bacterium]|nr:sugar ABC transporter substrate-binding protein [Anaerolineales bacterium]